MSPPRHSTRLSPAGRVWVLLAPLLLGVATTSGNNLLYLFVCPLLAMGVVDLVLGRLHLRGLQPGRSLPDELFAGRPGQGRLWLRNHRRAGAVAICTIEDVAAGRRTELRGVDPGQEGGARVSWRFPERGVLRLETLRLRSRWPLGLVEHELCLDRPCEVVVYPRPGPEVLSPGAERSGHPGPLGGRVPDPDADLVGLRRYRPGDTIGRLHWPTTARTGEPTVVERASGAGRVLLSLADMRGAGWERELSRVTGELLRATEAGRAVDVRMPDGRLYSAEGPAGRRAVLERLARSPRRPA